MSAAARAPLQLDLFGAVMAAYLDGQPRTNDDLYDALESAGHLSAIELETKVPVGKAAVEFSLAKRRVRWTQQSLKEMGLLERLPNERGTWRIAERDKKDLTRVAPTVRMLGFSTELGVAVWGSCFEAFDSLDQEIAVAITSPPYPLAKARAYGNPTEQEWIDFVCRAMEPIVKRLARGGNLAINLSADIFEPGLPSRSLYRYKFVLAMCERFGLRLMDDQPWVADNKIPGPYQWASKRRIQLNSGYEPVLIFCNDPLNSLANNQRVLQPHSEEHKKLIAAGGEKHARINSDGAYRLRKGAFGNATEGRIPRNVLKFGTTCPDQRRMRKAARAAGLPVHGASMPLAMAMFLVQYLSRPGDLVVDPFGGTMTTGKACEELGRMWFATEIMAEYIMAGRYRFAPESLAYH